MNEPLQKRAGNNMGVAPFSSGFRQASSAKYYDLSDTDTVLWEVAPGDPTIRSIGGVKAKIPGLLYTTVHGSTDLVEGDVYFVDQYGTEILIGDFTFDFADEVGVITIDGGPSGKAELPFGTLFPITGGEKVLLRVTTATKPKGRIKAQAWSTDIKVKGQGKGGISDGGAVLLRIDVPQSGDVAIEPFSGEYWEQPTILGAVAIGIVYANTSQVDAFINWGVQLPDGTKIFPAVPDSGLFPGVNGATDICPPAAMAIPVATNAAGAALPWKSQAGSKALIRFDPDQPKPPASARVTVRAFFYRLDVPADLNQEA